jgi:hypothetical protein
MRPATISFVAILLVLCLSCSRWSNDDEQFVRAYTEVLIAREQFPDTSLANSKVAAILKQHGFTELSFRQRFQDLIAKPDRLRTILDSARNRARRIAEEEQQREQKSAEEKRKAQKKKKNNDSAATGKSVNTVK